MEDLITRIYSCSECKDTGIVLILESSFLFETYGVFCKCYVGEKRFKAVLKCIARVAKN